MPSWETRFSPEGMAARAEIEEVIHLYCHAVDRRRWDMLAHVFHEDAVAFVSDMGGPWRKFSDGFAKVFASHLDMTQHHVSNIMIHFDGDVAMVETYCIGLHRIRADAPEGGFFGGTGEAYDFVGGLRYVDRFERRNGQWRIAERRGIPEWYHTQPANDQALEATPIAFRGRHGRDDMAASTVVGWGA